MSDPRQVKQYYPDGFKIFLITEEGKLGHVLGGTGEYIIGDIVTGGEPSGLIRYALNVKSVVERWRHWNREETVKGKCIVVIRVRPLTAPVYSDSGNFANVEKFQIVGLLDGAFPYTLGFNRGDRVAGGPYSVESNVFADGLLISTRQGETIHYDPHGIYDGYTLAEKEHCGGVETSRVNKDGVLEDRDGEPGFTYALRFAVTYRRYKAGKPHCTTGPASWTVNQYGQVTGETFCIFDNEVDPETGTFIRETGTKDPSVAFAEELHALRRALGHEDDEEEGEAPPMEGVLVE